jgi:hypothetical protein
MTAAHDRYTNVIHETEADGGWSGQVRIVAGTNRVDSDALVLVDSDLLGARRLVLTPEQAAAAGAALTKGLESVWPSAAQPRTARPPIVGAPLPEGEHRGPSPIYA